MSGYAEFLQGKAVRVVDSGGEPVPVHPSLYPFQRAIAEWAIRRGRAAVFSACGTGKTRIQLEWARQVVEISGRPVLVLAPLAVAAQTRREGLAMDMDVTVCRSQDEIGGGVNVANYEMLHAFDASSFAGVVLDESSILKSFMGKTKRRLIQAFSGTDWRLCCTATPAPNDHMELGNHAQFLGIMASNEMLARWFINDTMTAGNYRLKGHAVESFWNWVHSWAVNLEVPSDLGDYDDSGFVLPKLSVIQHTVESSHSPADTGTLFPMAGLSATSLHRAMRSSAPRRAERVSELVASRPGPWVVWCHTNYEADEIRKRITEAVEVRGSDEAAEKERRLNGFAQGEFRVLLTKPSIAGFGLNWQHCHQVAFVGLSYSFEQYYQAVRRVWRFGQESPVEVHIVASDSEGRVAETVQAKERAHKSMQDEVRRAMRRMQLEEDYELKVSEHTTESGDGWEMHRGDSVSVLPTVEADSVGLSVFSPPFSNLYIYSDYMEDLGNSSDDETFFEHFGYVIKELYRVTIPGRICAVHCKDLPLYKGRDGAAGLRDFPGRMIQEFERHGWTFHSRVTIWKSPVTEMQRTKNHGLLYKQLRKDSAASRQGMADYVIAFRKWGDVEEFPDPVTHTHESFPLDQWQEWASPVWMDIQQMRVLHFRQARGDLDERHICPLQLEVIERCIRLWSNPGDVVMSPFAGIGSEGSEAIRLRRRFVGIELKPEYHDIAVRNLRAAGQAALGDLFSQVDQG